MRAADSVSHLYAVALQPALVGFGDLSQPAYYSAASHFRHFWLLVAPEALPFIDPGVIAADPIEGDISNRFVRCHKDIGLMNFLGFTQRVIPSIAAKSSTVFEVASRSCR